MSKLITKALHSLKVPIDSVHPDPQNVRKHPESNKAAIKKSLQGFQQRKPIVVNKNTNIIEAGNGLWEQMKAIGAKEIAVVFVDDTDEQAKAYGVMDNRSAELAEWDLPGLKDILESLDTGAFDMDLTGFDTESIESLMTQIHEPNFGDVKMASQEAIDKKEAELKEQFKEKMRQELQKHIKMICPECGCEYSVKAEDLLKDSTC